MKTYIKQLNNEDNSIYYEDLKTSIEVYDNNNIFIYFGRHDGINIELLEVIKNMMDVYEYDAEYSYKNNVAAYVFDTLKRYTKITLKTAMRIAYVLRHQDASVNQNICDILSMIFNSRYEMTTLRGSSQSDYAWMFYNVDAVKVDYIRYVEAVLFNTGVEVMVHDEENEPKNADDVSGYTEYLVYYGGSLKKCVCEALGYKEEDVVFYSIKDIKSYTVVKVDYQEEK